MSAIMTFTGREFFPLDPKPGDIDILDIAHALANKCRYNGHCREFYSVAQHSVLVSRHVPREVALWGLLHDAAEAYLPDIARPIKADMPGFREIEARVMAAVTLRFGLAPVEPPEVKRVDSQVLRDEMHALMEPPWQGRDWLTARSDFLPEPPLGIEIAPARPAVAKDAFLARFRELIQRHHEAAHG